MDQRFIAEDEDYLMALLNHFGQGLGLCKARRRGIWAGYRRIRMEKEGDFVLGRHAVFQGSAYIKYALKGEILDRGHGTRWFERLAHAFHQLMDSIFGADRPKTMVWS